jgi:hypothetical protein
MLLHFGCIFILILTGKTDIGSALEQPIEGQGCNRQNFH